MTYEMIKRNYDRGLWNAQQVMVAVAAGVITQAQAEAIFEGVPETEAIDMDRAFKILGGEIE